jgi:hypothetical protein
MKLLKTMKRKLKDESGQALAMALIMLVLGGLLVVPTLSFMATNLNANRIIEEKTEGIHAADAGIQDALWKLGNDVDPFPGGISSYDLAETLNGMTVTVEKVAITQQGLGSLYTLKATSRLDGEVKAVITAQAVAGSATSADFSWMFEHAITSVTNVSLKSGDIIYGGVLTAGSVSNQSAVRSGNIIEHQQPPPTLPTADYLKAFYWNEVKNGSVLPSNYVIPGGTPSNPHMIPSGYANDYMSITGTGYAKLSGTIYVKGNFSVDDKNSIIDLNGKTIFAEGTGYFKPQCTIIGPGCIITVGPLDFQPNQGVGVQLLGVPDDQNSNNRVSSNRLLLSKFTALASGKLTQFHVKCYCDNPPCDGAHIKVALYADNAGAPKQLITQADTDNLTTIEASWNPINFPETQITKDNVYWMAAISDSNIIVIEDRNGATSKYKTGYSYESFVFPPDLTGVTLQSQTSNGNQYMFRGYSGSQQFILLMSVASTVNCKPGNIFYGCVVGQSTITLQPNCTLNLVGLPQGGLDFPGEGGGGSGSGTGGNSPPLLNYSIQ